VTSSGQQPAARIRAEINNNDRVRIQGSKSPLARPENDAGRVPGGTKLEGINIFFSRSAAQEADLQALIAAQQDPGSPQYHKWLTPEEFGARFGLADSDISKVQAWLEQQGFTVSSVSPSKNRITFSGTVAQAETGFGAELHYYNVGGEKHFAPSADFAIPAALASVVQTVTNLSTFKPHPHVKLPTSQLAPRPNFTSSVSGNHYLTPKDIATIYDIIPAYNAGYTGSGQSIAVVGQSAVVLSDIEHFQSAAGFSVKDPTLVLVPNSGTSTVFPDGNEGESDLDLEYSSTIANGATVYFVYTGNAQGYGAFDALVYAVDTYKTNGNPAPIISISYGDCEPDLGSTNYQTLEGVLAQAQTQGQTVVAAAGDDGSTDCYSQNASTALAVDYPASSEYVTSMGGTEFPSADVDKSNTSYWQSANGSDVIGSALSYIPEQVWNDDSGTNVSAGGGGVSMFTLRPSWQTAVTGIASGSYRLVPDISLTSSPNYAPFLFCTSDTSDLQILGEASSCNNGFRESAGGTLTAGGGTSFAVPIFAGMVAILGQKLNSSGQGVINPTLYQLAANTGYPSSSLFHDITSGTNATAGTSCCSATTGYDEATGLGSIDFYNLLNAWTSCSSPTASTTTLSAATSSIAPGANDVITITVASACGSVTTTPTGTVTIAVDGVSPSPSLALSNGSATYTFSSTTTGSHTIAATYSGDSTFASSSGSLSLTVTANKTFSFSATNVTVSAGSTGSSTITITPMNGYTGTVRFTVSSSPALTNGCFSLPNATVSGSSAVTATLTIRTNSSACASGSVTGPAGAQRNFIRAVPRSGNDFQFPSAFSKAQVILALAGLLFATLLGLRFRSYKLRTIAGVFLLVEIGFAMSGISGCSGGGSGSEAAKGTYTLTIVGTDTSSSSITASTTMTLTID